MPYELTENNNRYCVHKRGDSKPLKCYDNRTDALAYLRALEANVEDVKMMMLLTQVEANYTPVSTARGKACSACRFFCGDHCHIVEGEIAPNGYCDRYEAPPMMEEPAPVPVTIVEPEYAAMSTDEQSLFDRIWGRIQKALGHGEDSAGAFTVQKDLNGQWRWIATFTNNFKDREGEIISDEALDGYLHRLAMKLIPMPELWVGHIEGTKHGDADMIFAVGNLVTAVGHFDSPEIGEQAARYSKKYSSQTSVSHGFTFPSSGLKDGIYEVVNTFEISPLPPPLVASNPFTEYEVESKMKQITPEQKAALALYFGAEKADSIVKTREAQSEEIKAAGVAFKDFAQVKEEQSAETETTTPDAQALAIGDLLSQFIEGQAELLSLLTAQGKALAAHKADAEIRIKSLEDANAKLVAELKLTPRAASAATETKLSDKEAAEVKAQQDSLESDPFFS